MSKGESKMIDAPKRTLAAALASLFAVAVHANPEGAQVVQGTASFSTPSANVLNIRNSNGAIINWQRFDIAPGQTTNFIQPSADSSVLNRVVGNNPSRILGNLNSNGRVFLINQNGVLVGEGATIDTAGFFGSTLNLTDEDFLNGNLRFEGGGAGDFVNRGYIRAAGGNIVLIAPNIENGGVIEVVDGEVLLAAGRSITLAGIDNPSIRFEVTAPENRVVNLGQIIAERGAASLFAGTLRHSGRIRASGLVRNADGSISLVARESVEISGSIEARNDAGGGSIAVRAGDVALTESGRIDASAQGKGDGGEVILFADDRVSVQGEILARGGELGGDGGFIETSGLKRLDIGKAPDASAPNGVAGTWLIDPNDITIDTALNNATDTNISQSGGDFSSTDDGAVLTVQTIQTALDAGTNVLVQTTTSGANTEQGDIRILADITTTSATDVSLTLQAHNSIIFDTQSSSPITISATGTGALDLVLQPDSDNDRFGGIEFLTGTGNSFPITLALNGGSLRTFGEVAVLGENGLTLSDVNWYLDRPMTVDQTASLSVLDAAGSSVTLAVGRGGSLGIFGGMTGNVRVEDDGFLFGDGVITGNVLVAGGGISGGNGQISGGVLDISGELQIDRGLVYAVLGGLSVLESSWISAGTILLNGGDLMLLWEDASIPEGIIANTLFTGALDLLTCYGTGCMTTGNPNGFGPGGFSFSTVIDPMAVTSSSVTFDVTTDGFVRYEPNSIDSSASFATWAGGSGNWNDPAQWVGNAVPLATDYLFINSQDNSSAIFIDDARAAAGIQISSLMVISAGGSVTLNGRSMTGRFGGHSGGILFNAADATLAGSDVLYLSPGSRLQLDQGVSSLDMVSYGALAMAPGAAFQLDGNLVHQGYFLLDSAGTRTITGSGSLFNAGAFEFTPGADLQLNGGLVLRTQNAGSVFLGTGSLALNDSTLFDLAVAPAVFSPNIGLTINGGALDNAQNLPMPDLLVWNAGVINGDLTVQTGQQLDLNGAGNMTYAAGTLTNNGSIRFQSAGGDLQLDGLLVNNGLLSLNPSAASGIQGAGSIQQSAGALTELNVNQDFRLAVDLVNNGGLSVRDGRFIVDGVNLTQPAGALEIEGELRLINAALLDVTANVGINAQAGSGGPVGSITAAQSVIDFHDLGIDLSLLGSLTLSSNSRLQGMGGGAVLGILTRLQDDSVISGTGNLSLPAGSLQSFGGRLTGIDATNLLLIDNAGIIDTGFASTLGLEFARLQMSGDGVLRGAGAFDLLDTASLISGLTTGGSQNVFPGSLYIRNDSSELVANGWLYAGNLGWYAGTISGSGLTTNGDAFVSSGLNAPRLATDWTMAPGSAAEWRGDGDLLLDGGSIINQGELTILISAAGDGQKTLTRSGTTEILRNEGLLLVNDIPGGEIVIESGFDNAGGGIGLIAGTLRIDSNGDGVGDDLVLDQNEFLQGFGTYDGTVRNQAGFVSPGRNDQVANVYEAGQLTITGDYQQGAAGLLQMDLDSTASGLLADQLVVGGDLVAGGTLNFEIINNKSVLEIAALIDQSFQPFVIGGSFANRFDTVVIPDGLDFSLGEGGVITIGSDNPYLNLIADELQALIDNSELSFAEVAEALRPPERRIRLLRSRLEQDEEEERRRGGPRLVCR